MRILLTGGCGFIGSHSVRKLLSRSDVEKLINLDALTYSGQPMNLIDVHEDARYEFAHGSINDQKLVSQVIHREKIDIIVHLAAESHVDRSIESASDFIQTNVDGTRVLLEEVLRKKSEGKEIHFVHISTDEVYGSLTPDEPPFTESSPLNPMNPYSATKASSDMLVQAFVNTYGISAVITRCSNNYGPNQFPEKLIPLMTLNALSGKKMPVYGDGNQIRDWIHVSDHVSGIIDCMDGIVKGSFNSGEVFNFGSDTELRNIDIVKKIIEITGSDENLIEYVDDRPGHDRRYAMGFDKAQSVLGWVPNTNWQEGIISTIQWYQENDDWLEVTMSGKYLDWIESHYGG